jgi:hypothetical protein
VTRSNGYRKDMGRARRDRNDETRRDQDFEKRKPGTIETPKGSPHDAPPAAEQQCNARSNGLPPSIHRFPWRKYGAPVSSAARRRRIRDRGLLR